MKPQTTLNIAENELLNQEALKALCKRLKLKLVNGRYSKVKATKNLYLFFSVTKQNEINYKFVYRAVVDGKQKDLTLKARTLSLALIEMERLQQMNKGEVITIGQLWEMYVNSEKFNSLSLKSRENVQGFYKCYFDTMYVKTVLNQNVMELKSYPDLFAFLNKVLNQKTKSHHTISTAVYIIGNLFDVLATRFNILIDTNLPKLKKDLARDLPKQEVKHVKALIGTNGTIEELENNIIEFYKAVDLTECDSLTKLAIDFKMYSGLRGSEVLQLTKRNIRSKEGYVIVDKLKTLDVFSLPISETMQQIINKAVNLNEGSRYIFNKAMQYKTTNSTQLTHAFRYVSNHLATEKLQSEAGNMSAHGTRTLIREFFFLNEDKVLYSVAESCLTHRVGNKVTQSYMRNQFALTEYRKMAMQLWSDFLDNCKRKAHSQLLTDNASMKLEVV